MAAALFIWFSKVGVGESEEFPRPINRAAGDERVSAD